MNSSKTEIVRKTNIILIGMPGSGKSTIGPALAQKLGLGFVDTDDVVLKAAGTALKDYVAEHGRERFLELQEQTVTGLQLSGQVIATGGSVGCSKVLMDFLKSNGYAVYLKLDYSIVEQRLAPGRKLVREKGKTLKDLYDQRTPLYEAFADITVECTNRNVKSIVDEITMLLENL